MFSLFFPGLPPSPFSSVSMIDMLLLHSCQRSLREGHMQPDALWRVWSRSLEKGVWWALLPTMVGLAPGVLPRCAHPTTVTSESLGTQGKLMGMRQSPGINEIMTPGLP